MPATRIEEVLVYDGSIQTQGAYWDHDLGKLKQWHVVLEILFDVQFSSFTPSYSLQPLLDDGYNFSDSYPDSTLNSWESAYYNVSVGRNYA